jgi:hypothetical protein
MNSTTLNGRARHPFVERDRKSAAASSDGSEPDRLWSIVSDRYEGRPAAAIWTIACALSNEMHGPNNLPG